MARLGPATRGAHRHTPPGPGPAASKTPWGSRVLTPGSPRPRASGAPSPPPARSQLTTSSGRVAWCPWASLWRCCAGARRCRFMPDGRQQHQAELTLVASLPPSPEEIAEAESIREAVLTIRRTTEAVVALVADNAYGFADAAAERLYAALVDTNALCRQTEHGMLRCRPRAAAVALGGDAATGDALEQLSAEVAEAVAQFRLVATAARSASAQAKAAADAAGSAPPSAPPPPHDSWERLFELRGGGGAQRRRRAAALAVGPARRRRAAAAVGDGARADRRRAHDAHLRARRHRRQRRRRKRKRRRRRRRRRLRRRRA